MRCLEMAGLKNFTGNLLLQAQIERKLSDAAVVSKIPRNFAPYREFLDIMFATFGGPRDRKPRVLYIHTCI